MSKAVMNGTRPVGAGFTLLELMITVAIVGIISAIAYPSYQVYIQKARRADAEGALVSFAGAMERHFTVESTYCGAGTDSLGSCGANSGGDPTIYPTQAPLDGSDKYYNLDITSVSATSYILSATPISGSAQDGDSCGTLTVDETGAKGADDSDCW